MANYDYLYNKIEPKPEVNHLVNKKLSFQIIEKGIILPHKQLPDTHGFGGIIDSKGVFVKSTFLYAENDKGYTPREEELIKSSQSVIYLGIFVNIWGHCLTDDVKRIWFLQSDIYKKYFKNYPLVYVPMWGGLIPPLAKMLEILGVDVGKLKAITSPIQFENIILPDESFIHNYNGGGGGGIYFTSEYVEMIDRVRAFAQKNIQPVSQKKIYYFHGRNQVGEERVAEYFKSKGYGVVRPERLPFEQQLNVLANCESFASSLGSISHNIMFMRDNAEAIFIPRVGNPQNGYQHAIDQLRNINSTYIDTTLTMFNVDHTGPYCYIISKKLQEFFGDEIAEDYKEEDFAAFLTYIKYAISRGIKMNPSSLKYYGEVWTDFFARLKTQTDLMKKYGVQIK